VAHPELIDTEISHGSAFWVIYLRKDSTRGVRMQIPAFPAAGNLNGQGLPLSMDRHHTTRSRVIAWLLCALFTYAVIDSPHCDLCDVPCFSGFASQHTLVNHTAHNTQECNGICSCCEFHGLPNMRPALDPANTLVRRLWSDPSSPVLASRPSIFRPPRIFISS
jgi:hypothetical protein